MVPFLGPDKTSQQLETAAGSRSGAVRMDRTRAGHHDSVLEAQVEVVLGGGEEKLAMAGTVGIRSGGYAILPTTTQLVRTVATASAVIAGIEAVQMIRKGQVLWDYQS